MESLLVSIGAPWLHALGWAVHDSHPAAECRLYVLLQAEHGDGAHGRYNGLVRRLVSFEPAAHARVGG